MRAGTNSSDGAMTTSERTNLPGFLRWSLHGRAVVFFLAATSIWCLLADIYHLCSMRVFTFWVLIPSTFVLISIAAIDAMRGDGRLFRAVTIGAIGGFLAACSYDLFRIPWVIGWTQGIGPSWLRLPLFKVFPQFGAMIVRGQSIPTPPFTFGEHLLGWIYHSPTALRLA